ncbi:MAG: BNR-repeat neuraminidase N-terminal domain-containing protein [Ignavibacteria bacterium]
MSKFKNFSFLMVFALYLTFTGYNFLSDNSIPWYLAAPVSQSPNNLTYESFEGATFPPTGWTAVTGTGSQVWASATSGALTPAMPHSGTKMAAYRCNLGALGDNNTLCTPSFDLTSGQGVVNFWTYRNTELPNSPDSLIVYVNTAANLTGATVLISIPRVSAENNWYYYSINIPPSFNTSTNYLLFKGVCGVGNFVYLDDIGYGVASNMVYNSSTTSQNTNPILKPSTNNQIIGIEISASGVLNSYSLNKFKLSTSGSSFPSTDIRNAKIYYTGVSNSFNTSQQYGNVVANPNGSFEISGSLPLVEGTNYFWLTYDIPAGATSGNLIDATCDSIVISGLGTVAPLVPAPPGFRTISSGLSGSYVLGPGQVSPNYPTFTAAINDMALRGVSGPVTFNVIPGVYGTDAGIDVDSVITVNPVFGASSINTITFKKKSDLPGEVYVERRGTTGTTDYIIGINGADYFTFDSINVRQKDSTTLGLVEFGYSLMNPTAYDGAQYNTIRNNTIALKWKTIAAIGISGQVSTSINPLTTAGAISYNKIQNNIVSNCYTGVKFLGYASPPLPYVTYNQNNDISGNTITGFGGTTTATYAVYVGYENNLNLSNNIINGGIGTTAVLYGIYYYNGNYVNVNIKSNIVTLNNSSSATTAQYGIYNNGGTSGIGNSIYIANNILQNWNVNATGAAAIYGIYSSGTPDTLYVTGNSIKNGTITTTSTCYFINVISTVNNLYIKNDTIMNINKYGAGTSTFGIFNTSGVAGQKAYVSDNYISNIYIPTGATGVTALFSGIRDFPATAFSMKDSYLSGNTVSNIYANVFKVDGIANGYCINKYIFNNKINNLIDSSLTGQVYGIYDTTTSSQVNSVNTFIYNNSISNLRALRSAYPNAVSGIQISGGMNVRLYYNSIYLADTNIVSTATYGTSGISISDTNNVELKNNNVVNLSIAGSTGKSLALKLFRPNTLRNSSTLWNNNNWYVNSASATSYYYFDSISTASTISAFRSIMSPREQSSFSEMPSFVSAGTGNLRINTGTSTLLYQGGFPVTIPFAVTKDFDGTTRSTTLPSVGFTELSGNLATDIIPPAIVYSPLGTAGTSNRVLSGVNMFDRSNVDTASNRARIYYKKSINANTYNDNTSATDGWKYSSATGTTGNPYSFTIDYSKIFGGSVAAGDTVQYFVIAQDLAATPNVGINASGFTTAPSSVNLISANFPVIGTINKYVITGSLSSTINVGTGQTYTTLTGAGGLFAAINSGVLSGSIQAVITSDLSEPGTYTLNAWAETMSPNANYSLTIVPDGTTQRVISGWVNGDLIRFNGATNVTIDGGTGKYLLFRNKYNVGSAGIAGRPVFTFINGAQFNTIKNCVIESVNNYTNGFYPVNFATGSATKGNSYNTLAYNQIHERTDTTYENYAGIPYGAISSVGSSAAVQNSYNSIIGNEISNFTNNGIFVNSTNTGNGNGWIIKGNSFFFNSSKYPNTAWTCLNISSGLFASGYVIDSNYIGGSAPLCGGTALPYLTTFTGMNLQLGYDSINSVRGNIIRNIIDTNTTSSASYGIWVNTTGLFNVSGNYIGSTDTSKTIAFNGNFTAISSSVKASYAGNNLIIRSNTINNILNRRSTSAGLTQILKYGIYITSSVNYIPVEISDNTITNMLSWILPGTAGYNVTTYGIYIQQPGKLLIKNNTIENIGNMNTGTSPGGRIQNLGMYLGATTSNIGDSSVVSNNKIHSVFSSTSSGQGDICAGIYMLGATNGGTVDLVNNQVTMTENSGAQGQVIGILDMFTTSSQLPSIVRYLNNTVLIGGTTSASNPYNSYTYYKATSVFTAFLKNNIFVNARSGGLGNHYTIGGMYGTNAKSNSKGLPIIFPDDVKIKESSPLSGPSPLFISNYNLLIAPSSSAIAEWYGTSYNLAGWQYVTGGDNNSYADTSANIAPTTMFRGVSSGNLNIDTTQYGAAYVYKRGDGISSVNNDYNGYPRATSGPVNLGSHEFALTKPVALNLLSPANNSTGVQVPLTLVWTKGIYASSYRVQVSTDTTFASFAVNTSASDSTYTFVNPSPQTKYYWRVNPVYGAGVNGEFTSVYNFKVIGNASQVVLNAPANNSVNQPLNPTLNWFKSVDLTNAITSKTNSKSETNSPLTVNKYWFELASDSLFTTIIARDSVLTDTAKSVTGLTSLSKYYWRVKASNQFGWNSFSSVWNFTTVPPVPSIPVLVSPVNGATGIGLLPTISWNAVTYATTYRLQLSTDSNFLTTNWDTAGISGVQVSVPSGKLGFNTKYFWRVNASNAAGTGSYSSTWNFRTQTDPTALTMSNFTGVIPKYMASGTSTRLPVTFYGSVGGLTPGKTYRYYNMAAIYSDLGTTNSGAGILMLINKLTQTFTYSSLGSLTTAGQYGTFTANGSGNYTGWFAFLNSGNARFTAGNYVMPSIILGDSVGTVIARYALNDSINVLGFSTTAGAPNGTGIYGVSLALPKNFVALYDNTTGTGRPLSQTYVEDEGVTAASVAAFYTDSVNARNGRWGSIIPNALPNGVQRVEQKSYLDGSVISFNTSATGIWPSGTNTVNPAGGTTALRLGLNDAPLLYTNLVTPVSGTIDVSPTLTVTWASALTATGYRLQVSTDSNFVTGNIDTTLLATSLAIPSGKLTTNTKYYWRVNVTNTVGTSAWSSVWNFTTVPNSPNTPVLSTPSNGAVNQPTTLTFKWLKAIETLADNKGTTNRKSNNEQLSTNNGQTDGPTTIAKYWFELSTDSTFTINVLRDSTSADTSKTVTGLPNLTKYFWRVKALNQTGWSGFSNVWYYTTIVAIPVAPALATPLNNATGVSLTPAFTWNTVSGAVSYRIQVSSDSNFVTTQWDTTGVAGLTTTVPVGKLSQTTKYYWRVNATNAGGTGAWSVKWNFTTLSLYLTLNLKVYLEGFWNGTTQVTDTVKVYLANSTTFAFVDTAKVVLSATGTASMNFNRVTTGSYFIVVNHRNHLETWSKLPQSFVGGTPLTYDFTTAMTQAFGDNMKQAGTVWVLFGGDANRDGSIDANDIGIFITEFGSLGYLRSDFNGDEDVNASDVTIIANNFGLIKITPGVEPLVPEIIKNLKMQLDNSLKSGKDIKTIVNEGKKVTTEKNKVNTDKVNKETKTGNK